MYDVQILQLDQFDVLYPHALKLEEAEVKRLQYPFCVVYGTVFFLGPI